MAPLKVLVTGSTGFLGAHLCQELAARGHHVRAFHRPTSPLRQLEGLEVEHALGDLTQPETIQAAMQGIDLVFHAAAWMGGQDQAGQQYAVTVEGTRSVLQAALQAGVSRLVHTSSVAALGVPRYSSKLSLVDESHTWNYPPERYPYGYAKYLAEQEVQKAVAQGLDAVIVNPTVIFGAGDVYRQAGSVIMQVARRKLSVATEGGVNCVHIADVIEGHLAAQACGKTGERYILGGENLTYLELIQAIAEATGVPATTQMVPARLLRGLAGPAQALHRFLSLPVSPGLLYMAGVYFFYKTQKAENDLGLKTHRPVKEAILEAYEWFQQGGKPAANPA